MGDLQGIPSLVTYSTWRALVVQTVWWFLDARHAYWWLRKSRSKPVSDFLTLCLFLNLLTHLIKPREKQTKCWENFRWCDWVFVGTKFHRLVFFNVCSRTTTWKHFFFYVVCRLKFKFECKIHALTGFHFLKAFENPAKISQLILKIYMPWPKTNSTKKIAAAQKFLSPTPITFLMVRPLW